VSNREERVNNAKKESRPGLLNLIMVTQICSLIFAHKESTITLLTNPLTQATFLLGDIPSIGPAKRIPTFDSTKVPSIRETMELSEQKTEAELASPSL